MREVNPLKLIYIRGTFVLQSLIEHVAMLFGKMSHNKCLSISNNDGEL